MSCEGFHLPPAECTRSKRPALNIEVTTPKREKREKRRRFFITPRHLAFLYGSEFWLFMPLVMKREIVDWTGVGEHRVKMREVCREINSLPICPRYGFAILTEEQLGRRWVLLCFFASSPFDVFHKHPPFSLVFQIGNGSIRGSVIGTGYVAGDAPNIQPVFTAPFTFTWFHGSLLSPLSKRIRGQWWQTFFIKIPFFRAARWKNNIPCNYCSFRVGHCVGIIFHPFSF